MKFPEHRRLFRGRQDGARPEWPAPPPWRDFTDAERLQKRGREYVADEREIAMVNTAMYLRRPLLVTGDPGVGKSSLAYAVAEELGLGEVLEWPITTRTTLRDGLYSYDAVGRLHEVNLRKKTPDIGKFLRLGPLGTAMYFSERRRPRVLLVDELDKSDLDLPNDLLHVLEEGEFEIPELARLAGNRKVPVGTHSRGETARVKSGLVQCREFPVVIMTSNGERDFPPPFLRRCLRLKVEAPDFDKLERIVHARLNPPEDKKALCRELIARFDEMRRGRKVLATDQLLNAVHLVLGNGALGSGDELIQEGVLQALDEARA